MIKNQTNVQNITYRIVFFLSFFFISFSPAKDPFDTDLDRIEQKPLYVLQKDSSHSNDPAWNSRHLLLLKAFYPLKNKKYLSSLNYSLSFSSWLNKNIQKYTGRWSLRGGLSWIHGLPQKPKDTQTKNKESTTSKIPKLDHPHPLFASLGLQWELSYFPYITPILSWSLLRYNPFKRKDLKSKNYFKFSDENKIFLFTLGLHFSFDILDSSFSLRMQNEYNISDMGLNVEWRMMKQSKIILEQGIVFGLFVSF